MSTRPRRAPRTVERPALRVVRGRAPRRSSLVPAALVLVLAIFAVAALQAYVGGEGLRVNRLEREVRDAEERFALLRAQVAELSSPSRIEQGATDLGMVRAPEPVFVPAPGPLPDRSPSGGESAFETKRLLAEQAVRP